MDFNKAIYLSTGFETNGCPIARGHVKFGQLKSSGQLPQWATGFLHAGQLLELGSNNKNNNLNHLEIIKKTENQEKLSFLYVAKQ